MYGNFKGWLQNNALPWETYEEAKERYESLYGEDEPLEVSSDYTPTYEPEPEPKEEGFLASLGDTGEFISDVGTGLGRGIDNLQGTLGTITSDFIAPNLPESLSEYEQPLTDFGNQTYYDNLKEAESYGPRKPSRAEQNKLDDPNYQAALTKEEFIKQNPDHWKSKVYEKFPEWLPSWEKFKEEIPTGEELGELIPSSITPSIVGRTAGGLVGLATPIPGSTFAGQMAGGASASSLMTAAEVSREIRDNPTVRRTIGLDPEVSFQDDSYENRNKMNKLAKIVFKNSFANRLTSSGLPEMAGYASFGSGLGGVIGRAALDVTGGTASELFDIDMSQRSIVESLQEFAEKEGKPLSEEQVTQITQTLFDMGPKKREVFTQAFMSELLLGAPGAVVEGGLEATHDHRVDEIPTDTAKLKEMKKEVEKEDNKRLEIVGGAFTEIQSLYDSEEGNGKEQAYELYKTINKENRKQNALSDLLQKKRYDDIYTDFINKDNAEEAAKELQTEVDKQVKAQEQEETKINKSIKKEIKDEVSTATKRQNIAEKIVDAEEKTDAQKKDAKIREKKTAKTKKELYGDKKGIDKAEEILGTKGKSTKTATTKKSKVKKQKPKIKAETTKKTKADLKPAEAKRKEAKKDDDVIVLGNKFRTIEDDGADINTDLSNALDKINNLGKRNPLNEKEIIIGETAVEVNVNTLEDNALEVKSIRSWDKGKGNATKTLKKILDIAKEEKINLVGTAKAIGKDGATTPQLKKWYKKLGYEDHIKGQIIFRGDKVASTPEVKVEPETETTPKTKATTPTVDTTAPKTLIDRYNNALRNPEGSLRITMPETHRNKDKTIKDVLIEWEDSSDTFTRAELQELGAIQKKGDRESYVANTEVKSRKKLLQETLEKTKAERGKTPRPVALHIAEGIKEFKKKNPKATTEQIEAQEKDLGIEFLNKEKKKSLVEAVEKVNKETEAKEKAREEGEADVDGPVLSSATGKWRKKKKSKRLKKTDAPGISKDGVQNVIETFKKNSKQKIKDMNIRTLSRDDDADIEILREIYSADYDARELDPAGKDKWVNDNVEAIFEGGTEGFVDNRNGDVYIVADNIMAVDDSTSATDRLAEVLFHETLGHVGLRETLGKEYDTFINRFLKTHKKLLRRWATEGTGQAYLPQEVRGIDLKLRQKAYDKFSPDEKFNIAEEYIAQHFAEHGARDPNLIDRIGVHIARALNKKGIYKGISINQVKMTLAEVQQDYIGGNRNFITGENFRSVPLIIHDDDKRLDDIKEGTAEESVEGIKEAGLLSQEELIEHLADNPYTEVKTEKIGLQEEVELMGETIVGKMDTGATRSSIDIKLAKKLKLKKSGNKRKHKSAFGKEIRETVNVELKIKGQTFEVELSLSDRSNLNSNLLIGQDILGEGDFLVETKKGGAVSKSIRVPKKRIKKVYKLMDIRDGQLYYPFVEAKGEDKLKSKPQYPVELGEWQSAKFVLPKDMPGRGRGMNLSPRGGFHLTENLTPHLKTKLKDGTTRVWVEVEIGDDVNYQDRVGEKGRDTEFLLKRDKDGNVIDGKVPEGGQYRFKRPAKEGGWWRIAGEMRLLRILPESESNTLLNEYVTSKEYIDAVARSEAKKKKKRVGVSKSVRTPFNRVLDDEMQKQDVKIDPVAHAKASEKRMAEARRTNAQRESLAKTYGRKPSPELRSKLPTDTVVLSKEGVKKYLESKTAEGDGTVLGGLSMSKRLLAPIDKKTRKEMLGQNAVAMVADRLKLGEYTPLHGRGSPYANLMDWLHGGPDYAFESENRSKDGETYGVWASEASRIKALANAIFNMKTQYGIIVAGNPDQHKSNMDVWNVMWGETMNASKLGVMENGKLKRDAEGNILKTDINWINRIITEGKFTRAGKKQYGSLLEKTYTKSVKDPKTGKLKPKIFDVIPKDLKGKITDFESLMEQGKNLTFNARGEALKYIFGDGDPINPNYKSAIEINANGVGLHTIVRRTSAYPDAKMGDTVGIVKFKLDKDGNAIFGKASEIGIKEHPSYNTVIQGEGIINYKKSIPLNEYAREWLMSERENSQIPFLESGQPDFQDGMIYTSAMLEYRRAVKEAKAKGLPTSEIKKPAESLQKRGFTAEQKRASAKRVLEMKPDAGLVITKEMFPPEIMLKEHKKIPRTKGAINASKRLISQSVNFSNSRADNYERMRIASKGRGPLAGIARKLTRKLISQGTLEDFELYKSLRRMTKGTIMKMEQTADKFYKVIKNSKQQKEIYDYLTTPNADKNKITDEYERKIVVQVKKEIRENGRRLVEDHHLMTQKTLDRLDDQYLPRKYLKYLLRDSDYNLLSSSDGNITKLDLSYLNKRQDIEKGIRELILGEVKDPAFLSATAFATPRKDMAMLDFMSSIASEGIKEGRGWVLPKSLVTFDTLGLMKQLAGESPETKGLIKELELMDTKGVKVSGHWLVNEAERIQRLATEHMELDGPKTLLVKKLTDRMSKAGKSIVGDIVPKDYMRVPKGRKYGTLQGMAIRKEIFEDLFGWSTGTKQSFNINDDGTMDRNIAEKVLGTGGTFEQYNRFWKWSKVSANPPSWVRNFVSNLIFMNMGPIPLHRMPDLFLRSLKDQITTRLKQRSGDKENDIYDENGNPLTDTARADHMGLTSGGFSQVELKMIKSNFEEAVRRGDPQEGVAGIMTIRNAFKGLKSIQRGTSDLYGGIDSLGKIMMIKYLHGDHQINPKSGKSFNQRIGMLPLEEGKKPKWEGGDRHYTIEEAAAEAEKWLFDYSNPLPSVKYLRQSAFGAPFLSYPSFVAPLLIETILTKPWKFIPHLMFGEAMLAGFKWSEDISDEEYEAIVGETNEYIRRKAQGGLLDKFPEWVPVVGGKPWIPRSVLPVFNPFSKEKNLDSNGRAQLLEIGYLQPWGMFADIFRQLDPTKGEGIEPAEALHTFGLLSSPLINIATTILTNRDPFTDRPIYDEFATGGEKLAAWYHYMWNLSMPPMVHGMSQLGEGKGFGALTRLIENYKYTITREGEQKHTKSQALWRIIGINITPIAPHEARAMNVKREVAKINRLKGRIRKNAEDAYWKNMPVKDIEEMIKNDVKKMEVLYGKIKDRLSKPLPAKLKRSKKQKLKIMEEFLKKRRETDG